MEASFEEVSWIHGQYEAVAPKECVIDMPSNPLPSDFHWDFHGDQHSSESGESRYCDCGYWDCPCCEHMFSEEEHLRLNHEEASRAAMADEVQQSIEDMLEMAIEHDMEAMDKHDWDEKAFSHAMYS